MIRQTSVLLFFLLTTGVQAEKLNCPDGAVIAKRPFKNGGWSDYCEITRNGEKLHHGPAKSYRPDGSLGFVGQYKNGKPHGRSLTWHKNGKLRYEEIFDNGELISSKEWDQNGNLLSN